MSEACQCDSGGNYHFMKSPCYKPATCCYGVDCCYESDSELCWGQVDVRDEISCQDEDGNEDYMWLHACEGHAEICNGGVYKQLE
jgi:hypothetical protein